MSEVVDLALHRSQKEQTPLPKLVAANTNEPRLSEAQRHALVCMRDMACKMQQATEQYMQLYGGEEFCAPLRGAALGFRNVADIKIGF